MRLTVNSLQFRAAAVLLAVPAVLAAQSARISPKIHQTEDAVYVTIDVPNATMTCATGISPNGNIVGTYTTDQNPNFHCFENMNVKGFLLEGDRFTDIVYPVPPGPVNVTIPMKINAKGTIVGYWVSQPPYESVEGGWLWERGKFSIVKYEGPTPQGEDPTVTRLTNVFGINSSGDMAGGVVYLKDLENWNGLHGWFYDKSKDKFEPFDPLDSWFTFPYDVNDRGDLVGRYERRDGTFSGFIRHKDTSIQDIPAVPESWNAVGQEATGINAEGDIIGRYYADTPPYGIIPHGYVLSKGKFTRIDPPEVPGSTPRGINASGVIVGEYGVLVDGMPRLYGFVRIPKGRL